MQKAVKRYMPIFVLPTFCAFILGFIIPFIMGIWLSFCKFTTVTDAKFVGFSNYKKAFEDTVFRHSFWYTALFAVASLIIINAVAFQGDGVDGKPVVFEDVIFPEKNDSPD